MNPMLASALQCSSFVASGQDIIKQDVELGYIFTFTVIQVISVVLLFASLKYYLWVLIRLPME